MNPNCYLTAGRASARSQRQLAGGNPIEAAHGTTRLFYSKSPTPPPVGLRGRGSVTPQMTLTSAPNYSPQKGATTMKNPWIDSNIEAIRRDHFEDLMDRISIGILIVVLLVVAAYIPKVFLNAIDTTNPAHAIESEVAPDA